MFQRLTNNIFLQSFNLVKYNLVLFIPFFSFLLVVGFILMPLSSMAGTPPVFYVFFVFPALLAVFMSGWLNMFKECAGATTDENQEIDKRTEDSFLLFREFFPGVGKYFLKIALGIMLYFFLFNIFMLASETIFMSMIGGFESFSQQDLLDATKSPGNFSSFWETISIADKSRLYKIFALEAFTSFIFLYLTMFWFQIMVIQDMYPIRALKQNLKIIFKNPLSSFVVFAAAASSILLVTFVSAILSVNAILQLLMLVLFVFTIVYFMVLSFVYLEKYGLQKENTSHSRPYSDGQD